MGFNSAFKGLKMQKSVTQLPRHTGTHNTFSIISALFTLAYKNVYQVPSRKR